MTTQGRAGRPAADMPADPRRAGPGRRRIALLCALVAAVLGTGWQVVRLVPGDAATGGSTPVPVAGVTPTEPLTEAQSFTADWYFPAQRQIDQDGFQARRSGTAQGTDCAAVLKDRTSDVLHGSGCQGYLTVSFTSLDQKTLGSVTVLRFDDAAAAQHAAALLGNRPADTVAFLLPDGTPPPQPATAAVAAPQTAGRVEAVGHYLAVTAARYADGRTAPDPALDTAERAVAYTAAQSFLWL